jgi:hypothetical protein
VHSSFFLLAECLGFCDTTWRLGSLLIAELVEGFVYHLTTDLINLTSVSCVFGVKISHHRKCRLPHLIVVLVNFLPKGLDTGIFLSNGTIVKTEINFACLREGEAW